MSAVRRNMFGLGETSSQQLDVTLPKAFPNYSSCSDKEKLFSCA